MPEPLDYRCDIVGCRLRLRLLGVDAETGGRVWAAAVAVHECVSPPAQWPPQTGDVWADRDGILWAVRDDVEFVPLDGGADVVGGGPRWFLTDRLPAELKTRIGGEAAPQLGLAAEAARELMRDGAVRVVEQIRLRHEPGGGCCLACGVAWPCPTMTIVESVEPWATLARDGWQVAMGLAQRRYDQCDSTCTVDCGHCKGEGASR